MNHTESFWSRSVTLYDIFMRSNRKVYAQICEQIASHLVRDSKVLELACGTGLLSIPLAARVRAWEATDLSPEMIRAASRKPHAGSLHFSVQDASCLPYAAESFDLVLIANALHIIKHPDWVLSEIHRVLKPNGMLFAPTFIHGENTGYRFRVKLMETVGFRVVNAWSATEFEKFVAGFGFAVEQRNLIGSSIAPLCALAAHKME